MKIDILDIDDFIKKNNCPEVTNSVYFNVGTIPTDDGLFSYKLFGKPGSKARKEIYAYINLRNKFVHPSAFVLLKDLSNKFEDIILSKKFYSIKADGELVEDNENGKTGIKFLYDNIERITIHETGTKSRDKRLNLLSKLKKNEIFITKFLVIPCYYRDFNPSKNGESDEINKLYSKIILQCQSLGDNDDEYNFMGLTTESSIQVAINEIYSTFLEYLAHKTGMIHQALLGKTVDYSTRSVISTQHINSPTYKALKVPFGYTGVPLTQLVVLFYLYYVKFIQDFMEQHEFDIKIIDSKSKKEIKRDKLNIKEIFDEDMIKKILELFIKSEESRFQILYLEDEYNNIYEVEIFKEELGREFTLMDLIFLATNEIVKDKHVYITRYPMDQFQNMYPSKISVLSTTKTVSQTVNNTYFPNYPYIIPDYPCKDSDVIGTVVINCYYLQGLNADFDGDTVSIRGVYSVEANQEAENLIKSKSSLLNQSGTNNRSLKNEAVQALFTLTKL